MGRSGSVLLEEAASFLEFFRCTVGSLASGTPLRWVLTSPGPDAEQGEGLSHSSLFSGWGEPKQSKLADPVLLLSGQDCSLPGPPVGHVDLGRTFLCLCSHRMVGHNSSPGAYWEPWNPGMVLEMFWSSHWLLQERCNETITVINTPKKLPHPFSRSFLKKHLDCFFLLYRRNYGFHLTVPLRFIGSDWTQNSAP